MAWGYYFLPINPEHILWHLRQGRSVNSKPLSNLFQHYRERIIDFWQFAKETPEVNEKIGTELLSIYLGQLVITLYRLYAENVTVDVGTAVFAELDLSRHAGALVWGNEPTLFSALLIHAITADVRSSESGTPTSERLLDYGYWLTQVVLQSGVPFEVLDEAWYQLARYPLAMLDEAQDDTQRQVGLQYLNRILNLLPIHTIDYLLSTDIGPRLRDDFGLQLQELVTFQVTQESGGPLEFRLPANEWNRDLQLAIAKYLEESTQDTVSAGHVTFKAESVAPGSIFLRAQIIPTKAYEQFPDLRVPTQIICLLPGFTNPDGSHWGALWKIGLDALQRHQIPTDSWQAVRERFLQAGDDSTNSGNIARQQLLGKWPIAKEYMAQAARLNSSSVLQLLDAVEPGVVRGWLQMPPLDWSSSENLVSWANQIPLPVDSASEKHTLVESLAFFCHTVFPDALIVRQRALSLLLDQTDTAQHELIQLLLSTAEVSTSLGLKANIGLIVRDWLNGHGDEDVLASEERLDALIVRVLQGWTMEEDFQTIITQLNTLLCHWLYQNWSRDDNSFCAELAYLAFVGAGIIIDTLVVTDQVNSSTAKEVIQGLLSNLRSQPVQAPKPQPDGFFRPMLGITLNYAASHLLHGLSSTEANSPEYHTKPSVKEALLQCGVSHRIQQAFLGDDQLESSWLDSDLAVDIAGACTMILGNLSESDIEEWSEFDQYRIIVAASPDAAGSLAQQLTRAITTQETEAEILGSLATLFQGRLHPTATWCETLLTLFEPELLEKIRDFAQSYGEVVANFAMILIQQETSCPTELIDKMRNFLLEVPTDNNMTELIKAKAYVFAKFLHEGLDPSLVCQWIQNVVASEHLDMPTIRLAFRPFILKWQEFGEEIRGILFETLSEIAKTANYKGLWELERLKRMEKDRS